MRALHKAEGILETTNEAAREQENKLKLAEISKLIDLEGLEEVGKISVLNFFFFS
jgi:hypothetical protein